MAIQNTVGLPLTSSVRRRLFRNGSKSFNSTVGTISSFVTVPVDEVWELQTLRATNGEAAAREIQFLLTDADGTEHATLSLNPNSKESISASGILGWNGRIVVPGGWRIYTKWFGMAGGSTCNWQFTAIATDAKGASTYSDMSL